MKHATAFERLLEKVLPSKTMVDEFGMLHNGKFRFYGVSEGFFVAEPPTLSELVDIVMHEE